jgi:hypothetical protein
MTVACFNLCPVLGVLSGADGGGFGEFGVTGGVPACAGESPGPDDEGGFVVLRSF